jgi:hypothetical protein
MTQHAAPLIRASKLHSPARFLIVSIAAALIIAARRYPQFIDPEGWVEDARFIVPSLLSEGWTYIFVPLNGYFIVGAKLISWIALHLSFENYPLVSTILGTVVQAACVGAIAAAPLILNCRLLLAFAVVLVPIAPEPFGISLYTFWWLGLLSFATAFWDDRRATGIWIALIAFTGLSSPIGTFTLPIFGMRAFMERTRASYFALAVMALCSAVQVVAALTTHAVHTEIAEFMNVMGTATAIVDKYFGYYLTTTKVFLPVLGLGLFLVIVGGFFTRQNRYVYGLLLLALAMAILSSIVRVPVAAPHPVLAGPRYFFYPFIFISWLLTLIISTSDQRYASMMRALAAAALLGGGTMLAQRFVRHQQAITPWADQVAACLTRPTSTFVIHRTGMLNGTWPAHYTRQICEAGFAGAIF